MRALLVGALSATLLSLLAYGGSVIAGRRARAAPEVVDAPEVADAPAVGPAVTPRWRRPLPSVAAAGCVPRRGWACWRGRLVLSPEVRLAWAELRAGANARDGIGRAPVQPLGDGVASSSASSRGANDDDGAQDDGPLPPESAFDQFFTLGVSRFVAEEDARAGDARRSAGDRAAVPRAPSDGPAPSLAAGAPQPIATLFADGTFEIQVPPGRYDVEAASEENLVIGGRDDLRAVAGAAEDGVDITLAPAVALSGRVLDEDDLPLAATVTAARAGENGAEDGTSSPDGTFHFGGLRPGPYRVTATTGDGPPRTATFIAPLDGITLRLPRQPEALLVLPRAADGSCLPGPWSLDRVAPDEDDALLASARAGVGAAGSPAGPPRRMERRHVWTSGCQAIVEDVPPGSAWSLRQRDPIMHAPLDAEDGMRVVFGQDAPLAPVCVGSACPADAAALDVWLVGLDGSRLSLSATVTEDEPGAGQPPRQLGYFTFGLRANRGVTIRVDLDGGPVTRRLWLSPGVNRAVIRLPLVEPADELEVE